MQAAGGAGGAGRDPAAGQEDAALGPARPGAQRPAPSARRSGRARCPGPWPTGRPGFARSAAGTAAAAAPGPLWPAGGAFQAGEDRGPARPGRGRRGLCRGKRSARREGPGDKKGKIGPRWLPGRLELPLSHAVPVPLGWAPRVRAAVPDARVTSRGRDRRLWSRGPAAAAAPVVTCNNVSGGAGPGRGPEGAPAGGRAGECGGLAVGAEHVRSHSLDCAQNSSQRCLSRVFSALFPFALQMFSS